MWHGWHGMAWHGFEPVGSGLWVALGICLRHLNSWTKPLRDVSACQLAAHCLVSNCAFHCQLGVSAGNDCFVLLLHL
jgi:hypothetical protein